jgi:hypothetical protein
MTFKLQLLLQFFFKKTPNTTCSMLNDGCTLNLCWAPLSDGNTSNLRPVWIEDAKSRDASANCCQRVVTVIRAYSCIKLSTRVHTPSKLRWLAFIHVCFFRLYHSRFGSKTPSTWPLVQWRIRQQGLLFLRNSSSASGVMPAGVCHP